MINKCNPFCRVIGQSYCGSKQCTEKCTRKMLDNRDIGEYQFINIERDEQIAFCQFTGERCNKNCRTCNIPVEKLMEEFNESKN